MQDQQVGGPPPKYFCTGESINKFKSHVSLFIYTGIYIHMHIYTHMYMRQFLTKNNIDGQTCIF